MAHREPESWELCDKGTFLNVHAWSFETEKVKIADSDEKEDRVTAVECIYCSVAPPEDVLQRLSKDYEVQKKRDRIAKELNKAQKEGTGVNLVRK